jgi:mxaJ protein
MIPLLAVLALRVCADPNNMPFSNRAGEGFENRIADVLARELHETPVYTWWAQRRGFLRNTVGAGRCDVVIGIGAGADPVATTPPYYRSSYVFVTRRDRDLDIASFDDPRLGALRVGVHVIGADYNSLPPVVAMATRGLVRNVVGYSIYGNYAEESPPSALIDAVRRGDVDIAVAWGPLAGYYAARSRVPLRIVRVTTPVAARGIPFTYAIAVGVRRDSTALRARLAGALRARRAEIKEILDRYGVPCV